MNNLMNSLRISGKEELKKVVKNIESGNMNTINFYTTNLRQQQLKDGKITLEKAQGIAIKKATKEIEKQTAKKMDQVKYIASTITNMEDMNITIQCKKTNLGYQYKATLVTDTLRIEGKYTGGWGYDKLSTAIAEVLNQYYPLIKLMYKYIDDKMFEEASLTIDNHEVLGYGSGYGILPYFESGVGVSCFYKIFDNLGLKFAEITDNFYRITRKSFYILLASYQLSW